MLEEFTQTQLEHIAEFFRSRQDAKDCIEQELRVIQDGLISEDVWISWNITVQDFTFGRLKGSFRGCDWEARLLHVDDDDDELVYVVKQTGFDLAVWRLEAKLTEDDAQFHEER